MAVTEETTKAPIVDVIEYERGEPTEGKIDPITARVIAGALDNIALEVGHKLTRMAYSSIIRESEDFGVALLDAEGRQICECALSTPLQLGPIPGYVRGIMRLFEERGDTFNEGDVIVHNSPYYGASHEPDVGFCVPIFVDGELVGFSVTTAHHLDVGAMAPGSCGIVDAVDAYAEGLQFKALKVYDRGVKNDTVWRLMRDNIRAQRHGRRRHGGPGRRLPHRRPALRRAARGVGPRDGRGGLRGAHGLLRAHAAPGDRAAPRRHLQRRGVYRRLRRRSRPGASATSGSR